MHILTGVEDCAPGSTASWPTITSCAKFYEWNARTQLTTWNPTPKDGGIPGGPIDYASKHWSGTSILPSSSPSNITRECPHPLLILQGNTRIPF